MTQVQQEPITVVEPVTTPREGILFVAVAVAWLVPGAGHLILGRWVKALLFFVLISACFGMGVIIGGVHVVSYADDPLAFFPQVFNGAMGLGMNWYAASLHHVVVATRTLEMGRLYACVAGLLNVLALLNVWATHHRAVLAAREATASAPEGPDSDD